VAFSADDVLRAMAADLVLGAQIKDRQAALEHALMYLHEQHVLILQQGLAVFRQSMTIRILPDRHGDRFTKGDYSALDQHYQERIFQVHVMNEYARLALDKVRQALALVAAYFTVGKEEFVRRYFSGRQELVERATSAESYRRIVDELRNASQVSIVAAKESENMLVLAGPGSGKTRVVAHRCAYLLRVERVQARAILVLCFNRNAALTLRRRLLDLVGADARAVTVSTYHSLAMRLIGASFAERAQRHGNELPDFKDVIKRATCLLKGEIDLPGLEKDELRDRLLAGYRHILVDEYQDIDPEQYDLVSAIAGRTRSDSDSKLSIMAVGDDDQSIYGWRDANVEFIRRFAKDYDAKAHYLVENYRSTTNIVAAANQLIALNRDRMKTKQPIRVNQGRRMDDPGGRWTRLDPVGQGRVQVLRVADPACEASAVVTEMERIRTLDPKAQWADFAVLARTAEELAPVRALCEHRHIPVIWNADKDRTQPLHRIREIAEFLAELKDCASELRRAADLQARLAQVTGSRRANPWFALLGDILAEYREDSANAQAPVGIAIEFIYDALADRRREHFAGAGIFLATVHAAKGTESPHVLVMGGGWPTRETTEEERRVYYVAMTRAKETVCLLERRDCPNPFLTALKGDFVFNRDCPPTTAVEAGILDRRYEPIGMADVHLDMAGRRPVSDPVHRRIAALQPGDSLRFQRETEGIYLVDADGEPVARLSQQAYGKWKDRVASVDAVRVAAVVMRETADCTDPNYAALLLVPSWGIPLAEVTYRRAQ
jgi:ATP-dependent DNA helicase RecQ